MKILKSIFITILLLANFSLICKAQTSLGIGIISINFDDKPIIYFYQNPNDKKVNKIVEFFNDQSINSLNIKNLGTQKKWLKPETLWLDYSSFNFRCKSKTKNWYQVIVNNESGQTLWIKREKFTKFLTWAVYLKSKFVVERLPNHKQAIRKLPSKDSAKIKYVGEDCFQIRSMKGEWIEVFTSDFCRSGYADNNKTIVKSGWLRWKNGNTLLINYANQG